MAWVFGTGRDCRPIESYDSGSRFWAMLEFYLGSKIPKRHWYIRDICLDKSRRTVLYFPTCKQVILLTTPMSTTPTRGRRSTPTPKIDALAFRLHNDPTFVQAVNRAANLKCLAAIKSGRLRVVQAATVDAPLRYSPRYVTFM